MSKVQETTAQPDDLGLVDPFDTDIPKKPNWVDLAQLNAPIDDNLVNNLLYKPALRFHGVTSGLWGLGLSRTPSLASDSRPPSYKFSGSINSKHNIDASSNYDQRSLSQAVSPVTLRRRNTIALILLAIALVAAVGTITGIVLHLTHPKALLRGHVRFTIANENFDENMLNKSSDEFKAISSMLCSEMDLYYRTSELSDFYLGCRLISLSNDTEKPGLAVHYTIDFQENPTTHDKDRIRDVILRKSGRQASEGNLFFVIRDYLVYLRSLRVDLEKIPLPKGRPDYNRPMIPWRNDLDFIARKSDKADYVSGIKNKQLTVTNVNSIAFTGVETLVSNTTVSHIVLPNTLLPVQNIKALRVLSNQTNNATASRDFTASKDSSVIGEINGVEPIGDYTKALSPTPASLFITTKGFTDKIGSEIRQLLHGKRNIFENNILNPLKYAQEDAKTMNQQLAFQNHVAKNGDVNKHTRTIPNGHHHQSGDTKHGVIHEDHIISSLQTSFGDLDGLSYHMLETSTDGLQSSTSAITLTTLRNKISKISKDMFLINGESSRNYKAFRSLRPTSVELLMPENKHINYFQEIDKNFTSNNTIIERVPDEFEEQKETKQTGGTLSNKTSAFTGLEKGEFKMEMNEMLAPNTVRTNISPVETEVQWVNIFNLPRKTVDVYVGEVVGTRQQHAPSAQSNTINILNDANMTDTVKFAIRDLLPDFKKTVHQWSRLNVNNRSPGNQQQSDKRDDNKNTSAVNNQRGTFSFSAGSNTNNHFHLNNRPHFHTESAHGVEIEKDETRDPQFQHPNFRVNSLTGNINNNHVHTELGDNVELEFPDREAQVNTEPKWEERSKVDRFGVNTIDEDDSSSRMSNSVNGPARIRHEDEQGRRVLDFNTELFDRTHFRRDLFLPQPGSEDLISNIDRLKINTFQEDSGFPNRRILFHRNGIKWHFPPRASSIDTDSRQNVPHDIFEFLNVDSTAGNPLIRPFSEYNDDMRERWTDFHNTNFQSHNLHHFNRFEFTQPRRRSTIKIHEYPERTNTLLGIPFSTEFDDIEDVKGILKEIIASLFNMTEKIDSLQGVIDFINKTVHMDNRPIYRLEETLQNISDSLDNLKVNMNNINKTLNGFRIFLQQFDGTIFEVGDVMKNLDETFLNLDKTVSFVGDSLDDLSMTVSYVDDIHVNGNTSLVHLNNSAYDVMKTTNFANRTLDSMSDTLESLENAVDGLNVKVDEIIGGIDGINISLRNINETVQNAFKRMKQINDKMNKMNSTVDTIEQTVERLNKTYRDINDALNRLNETFVFINGTALEVIQQLKSSDKRLRNISDDMNIMRGGMLSMNNSLKDTIDWMMLMTKSLEKFDLGLERNNNTLIINIKNTDLIETLSVLLGMNDTLFEFGGNVDHVNEKLDGMENNLYGLEKNLEQLRNTLENINITFRKLNDTLETTNTTVKSIKQSFGKMNQSIEVINQTSSDLSPVFDSIRKTLDKVNSTITKVNETANTTENNLLNLNSTFHKIGRNIGNIKNLTLTLSESIKSSDGSLPDLNSQLYNANESLRIIHGKANIVNQSYEMLMDTLSNIEKTMDTLFSSMNDTSTSLGRVNESFKSINDSLFGMEAKKMELSEHLDILLNSHTVMHESLKDIGPAFPNLMENMDDLFKSIKLLQAQVTGQSRLLSRQNDRQDRSYDRYLVLKSLSNDMKSILHRNKHLLGNIRNVSAEIGHERDDLGRLVTNVDSTYQNINTNLRLLTQKLPPLQEAVGRLNSRSDISLISLHNMSEKFSSSFEQADNLKNSAKGYENINVPFEDIYRNITSNINGTKLVSEEIEGIIHELNRKSEFIWNEEGQPVDINRPTIKLEKDMELLNIALNGTEHSLEQVRNKIFDMGVQDNEIQMVFEKVTSLMNQTDTINNITENTDKKMYDLKEQITTKLGEAIGIGDRISGLVSKLTEIKHEYGNINGTHNGTTDTYLDLEKMLYNVKKDINGIIDKFNSTMDEFLTEVEQFNRTRQRYNKTTFGINRNSDLKLQGYISDFRESDRAFSKKRVHLDNITSTANGVTKFINEIETLLDSFQTELVDKANSHNFLKIKKPKVLGRVNNTKNEFDNLTDMLTILQEKTNYLLHIAENIENRSKLLPNVDISLDLEYSKLHGAQKTMDLFKRNLSRLQEVVLGAKSQLEQLSDNDLPFASIRNDYQSIENTIENVITELKLLSMQGASVYDDLQNVSKKFDEVDILLSKYNTTRIFINDVGDDVGGIMMKTKDSEELLSLTKAKFNEVDLSLKEIEESYSNFTATDVNLSESFIPVALKEIEDTLRQLTTNLNESRNLVDTLSENFTSLNTTMQQTEYNRTNMNSVIDEVILKPANTIRQNVDRLNSSLSDILSTLKVLDTDIDGVNETIHTTNKQLFIDRQKKLFADSKFPDMETEHLRLNSSLLELNSMFLDITTNISEVMQDLISLNDSIGKYPRIDISTDDLNNGLVNLTDSMLTIKSELGETAADLNSALKILYTRDGKRYANNETIGGMQDRYKKASNSMKHINEVIDNLRGEMLKSKNELRKVYKEISSLNKTVDKQHSLDTIWNDIMNEYFIIQNNTSIVQETAVNIDDQLRNIQGRFMPLKERFTDINETFFINLTVHLAERIGRNSNDSNAISSRLKIIDKHIAQVDELLKNRKEAKSNIIKDKKVLKEANAITKEKLANATEIIDALKSYLNGLENRTEVLNQTVASLDDDLHDVIILLERREKKEFYEKNSLENLFDQVKDTIRGVGLKNKVTEDSLENATRFLLKLQENIKRFPSIIISTEQIENQLDDAQQVLRDADTSLKNWKSQHKLMGNLVNSPVGFPNSDNETIENMKERFNTIYQELQKVLLDSNNMTQHVNFISKTKIPEQSRIMNDLHRLLYNYSAADEQLKSFSRSVDRLQNANAESKSLHQKRGDLSDKIIATFADLNAKHRNTTSPEIEHSKELLKISIEENQNSIRNLKNATNITSEYIKHMRNQIGMFSDLLFDSYSTSDGLKEILRNFGKVNISLTNGIEKVDESILDTNSEGNVLDNKIYATNQMIKAFKDLLEQEEKRSYVSLEADKMHQKYIRAIQALENSTELTKRLKSPLLATKRILKNVKTYLKTVPTVNISMEIIEDETNERFDFLRKSNNTIKELKNNLVHFNFSLQNASTADYMKNNTLDEIKEKFSNLTNILDTTITNTHLLASNLLDLKNSNDATQHFIRQTENELFELEMLGKIVENVIEDGKSIESILKNVNKSHSEIKRLLQETNSNMAATQSLYTDIHSPKLLKRLAAVSDLINSHILKSKRLDRNQQNIQTFVSENVQNSEYVDSEMNKSVDTLSGLQNKTTLVRSLVKQLQEEIDTANLSINSQRTNHSILLEEIRNTSKLLDDLKDDLRQQQMLDFIESHFPLLTNKYSFTNQSLRDAGRYMREFNDKIKEINGSISNLSSLLSLHPIINVSLVENIDGYTTLSDDFENVLGRTNDIEDTFYNMSAALIQRIGEQDSIAVLEQRFNEYNKTLDGILTNITKLNATTETLFNDAAEQLENLTLIENKIADFDRIRSDTNNTRHRMNQISIEASQLKHNLTEQKKRIDNLNRTLAEIKGRLKFINSTVLNNFVTRVLNKVDKIDNAIIFQISEYETVEELLETHVPQLRKIENTLDKSILDIHTLSEKLNETTVNLPKVQYAIRRIENIVHLDIANGLANRSQSLTDLESEVKELIDDLLESEKQKYLNAALPGLLDTYKDLHENLTYLKMDQESTVEKISKVNRTFIALTKNMNMAVNIDFNTSDLLNEINRIHDDTYNRTNILRRQKKRFNSIDGRVFTESFWDNFTLDRIKKEVNGIQIILKEIKNNASEIKRLNNQTVRGTEAIASKISDISGLINRYIKVKHISFQQGERITALAGTVNQTGERFKEINSSYQSQNLLLRDMITLNKELRNKKIRRLITAIENILTDNINSSLPLIDGLRNRIEDRMTETSETHRTTMQLLNETHTLPTKLDSIINDTKSSVSANELQEKEIKTDFENFTEEANRINNYLYESESLLLELKQSFQEERKRRYLAEKLPNLVDLYESVSNYIMNTSDERNRTENALFESHIFLQNFTRQMRIHDSLNISHDFIARGIRDHQSFLQDVRDNLTRMADIITSYSPYLLNTSGLIKNKSIDIHDLKVLLFGLKDGIIRLENDTGILNEILSKANYDNNGYTKELHNSEHTFTRYKKDKENLNRIKSLFNDVNEQRKNTTEFLENKHKNLQTLNVSIQTMHEMYESIPFDGAKFKKMLKEADDKLKNLTDTNLKLKPFINKTENQISAMERSVHGPFQNIDQLRESVTLVQKMLPGTEETIETIRAFLTDIDIESPVLNLSMKSLENDVNKLNKTLFNENEKIKYSEEIMPKLRAKYDIVNMTFDITNKSLHIMRDNIDQLDKSIRSVKKKISEFENINISVADLESNVTYMEDRLTIMQEHYDNVKEVVEKLRTNLTENDISGESISVHEIKHTYDGFNKTLETLESVIRKVDMEITEMDDHLMFINDTIISVNDSLTEFENERRKTNNMKLKLDDIEQSIAVVNSSIGELAINLENLNSSFKSMQKEYSDVIDVLSKNNTQFEEELGVLKSKINDLNKDVANLYRNHALSSTLQKNIHKELFKNISSTDVLDKALSSVIGTFVNLSNSLDILSGQVQSTENSSSSLNSTLNGLGEILTTLNETLHNEQVKYNFLTSNYGDLQSKTKTIESSFVKTDNFLSSVKLSIGDGKRTLKKLNESLNLHKNLDIPLERENSIIKSLFQQINNISRYQNDSRYNFQTLMKNMTTALDGSGHISDIRRNYAILNESLDELGGNINSINKQLNATQNNTSALDDHLQEFLRSLSAFKNVSHVANGTMSSIGSLSEKLLDTKDIIHGTNETITTLDQETKEMVETYANVDDITLKDNLTSIMTELAAQREVLHEINSKHNELKQKGIKTKELGEKVQKSLQGILTSKKEVDSVVTKATADVGNISDATSNITRNIVDLGQRSLEVQKRIAGLEDKLKDLNETFYEEKIKIDFVRQNFPSANARFNSLSEDISVAEKGVKNASTEFKEINSSLSDLGRIIDTFPALNIPLAMEKKIANDIKREISELKHFYQNISSKFDRLNVTTLKDRDKTYIELRNEYRNFDSLSGGIEGEIDLLGNRLKILNEKLRGFNISLTEVNSTLRNYDDMTRDATGLFEEIRKVNELFKDTNQTVTSMENTLKRLDETLKIIVSNFTDVKNPVLLDAKEAVQNLLNETMKRFLQLKNTTSKLNKLNGETDKDAVTLNSTLLATKKNMADLKKDISFSGGKLNDITSFLTMINENQTIANQSSEEIEPKIQKIIEKLKDLHSSFEEEKAKLRYIADKKPVMQMYFKNLDKVFNQTNDEISKTETNLADLKFSIKRVGDRLTRFKPINITTEQEMMQWQDLRSSVQGSSKEFIELGRMYNLIKKDKSRLDDRNRSITDIKTHYKEINKTLDVIFSGLSSIGTGLNAVAQKEQKIDRDMRGFDDMMDDFKTIQNGVKTLLTKSGKISNEFKRTQSNFSDTLSDVSTVKDTVHYMEAKYKVLSDETLKKSLPEIKTAISSTNNSVRGSLQTLSALNASLYDTILETRRSSSKLQNTGLTRLNAKSIIESVNKTVSTLRDDLDRVRSKSSSFNKTLSSTRNKISTTQERIRKMNQTLSKELKKFLYVNKILPVLKEKHKSVNSTFRANVPDVKNLQAQINNVVTVIERIKEKIRLFSFQDSDASVKKWDQSIHQLNKTVNDIIKRNKQTSRKLTELKKQLWKKAPMYTKRENLRRVQKRMEGYNKSLDDIIAAVHQIDVKLLDLDQTSKALTVTLVDHDNMLTTTPEPVGPPDWIQFTSTDVGIIGRDPGIAECSVGDLTDWEVMKITRQRGNNREETVAAWKLGLGARKIIRDRRISVKKSQNSTGGSLAVNIRSLQCEDEAAYYCALDTYRRYPLRTDIAVQTPAEDSLDPEFPTEVFEDKVANFSCTGHPGYPNGRLTWKVKHENEKTFKDFTFYSAKKKVTDVDCIRSETNTVNYQFDMTWNNTKIRCYIENTNFYGEGIIRLLPYDICNKVRFLGTISHPYTPHKYIVCGKELNIMQCPGNTCYDKKEENCVQCKAGQQSADPCHGKPLYSYVPHEKDCRKYYICMGPTKTVKKCTKGYFNPNVPGYCAIAYAQSYCAQRSG